MKISLPLLATSKKTFHKSTKTTLRNIKLAQGENLTKNAEHAEDDTGATAEEEDNELDPDLAYLFDSSMSTQKKQ